jgi:hypothetical protein
MRRLMVTTALCLLAACSGGAPDDALFVLPGDFSEGTTVADLEARFGKENVTIGEVPNSYQEPPRGVILFPNDPTRRAYVAFWEEEPLSHLASIQVVDAGSRWRGKHGVRIGMTLAELQKVNAKPFYFTGFDDKGRAVVRDSWSPALDDDDGALGTLDVAEGERLYFEVSLGLRDPKAPLDAYPREEGTTMSNDPRFPRLGELVEVTGFGASSSLDDEWS